MTQTEEETKICHTQTSGCFHVLLSYIVNSVLLFVLSIVFFCCPVGIVSVVTGCKALL